MDRYVVSNRRTREKAGPFETLARATLEWYERIGHPRGWRITTEDGRVVFERCWDFMDEMRGRMGTRTPSRRT